MNARKTQSRFERGIRRFGALEKRVGRVISIIAVFRFVAFVIGGICGLAALLDGAWTPYGPIALGAGIVFIVAVLLHRRPFYLEPRARILRLTAEEEIARAEHRWEQIPQDGSFALKDGEYALSELKVFGRASLFQLLNRTGLPTGRKRLAALLGEGVEHTLIDERQQAAAELAHYPVLRRRFEAEARLVDVSEEDLERMLVWADGGKERLPWLSRAVIVAAILTPLTLIQAVMTAAMDIPTFWALTFLAQVGLFLFSTGRLSQQYVDLIGDAKQRPIVALRAMYALVEKRRFKSDMLCKLQSELAPRADGPLPSERIKKFENIVEALAVRHSSLLYSVVSIVLMWEVFQCARLEKWRQSHGVALRRDFEILAEFEALSSIGGFAAANLDFCWPKVNGWSEDQAPWLSLALGPPLIKPSERRANDFSLTDYGALALITGSNMSGKSTFLRTVGINARLALAGAPACARALSMVELQLATSIQVVDDPEQGWSRFYAEVRRISGVLQGLSDAEEAHAVPRLYLIDEMLSGTNSRERRLACRNIVRKMVSAERSFGLVTTHDLDLVDLSDELAGKVICYHFSDQFDGERLHFDYRLKEGVAQTTNALHVLRMEGVDVDES